MTARRAKLLAKADARLQVLVSICRHPSVVTLCSAYEGSRSYDHDDRHEEVRRCLVCGQWETGPDFRELRAPKYRFEFGGARFNERLEETPMGQQLLKTPLARVLKFAAEKGYRYTCVKI